jgi:hypothetical protein
MAVSNDGLSVKPSPISGRFLAHNHHDLVDRAFYAADLHLGAAVLTMPTVTQAAILARVNRSYAGWAIKRIDERPAIEQGLVPLVPASHAGATINGNGHQGLPAPFEMPDYELVKFVRSIGVNRVLEAAVVAEAAE